MQEKELQQRKASEKSPRAAKKGSSSMDRMAKETTKYPQTNGTNCSKRPNQVTKVKDPIHSL
jgi:hypothetical protein